MPSLNKMPLQKAETSSSEFSKAQLIDYNYLEQNKENLQKKFKNAEPFPHIIIDNFLNAEIAEEIEKKFTQINRDQWLNFTHYNEYKFALNDTSQMPDGISAALDLLNCDKFLKLIEEITGIDNLIADPQLEGGGMHLIKKNGFLNIHTDFSTHPVNHNWQRKLNLLLYLNKNWKQEYGGEIEFWNEDITERKAKIPPVFNRCVIFKTDDKSFHGHPEPLNCPENEYRKSLAVYYYQNNPEASVKSTNYRSRPNDPAYKKALIAADRNLVSIYSFLKKNFKFNNKLGSNFLKIIKGKS